MSPHDESQIDAVTRAFFAAFDNRDGRRPDMNALRRLFIEGAVIVKATLNGETVMTVEAFIAPRETLLTSGRLTEFHEWEETSHTSLLGAIAWRQCTYRKAGLDAGQPIAGAGVKALSFVRSRDEWKIASVLWQDEEPGLALDDKIPF